MSVCVGSMCGHLTKGTHNGRYAEHHINVLSALCTPGAGGEVVHESHRVLQQGHGRTAPKAIMDEGQGRKGNAVPGQDVEWVTYVSITEQGATLRAWFGLKALLACDIHQPHLLKRNDGAPTCHHCHVSFVSGEK